MSVRPVNDAPAEFLQAPNHFFCGILPMVSLSLSADRYPENMIYNTRKRHERYSVTLSL
jgi:hypothetical protein